MELSLSVTLILLSVVIHEIAHAWEMKKNEIKIDEIGIGIKLPCFAKLHFYDKWLFDCKVYFSPLILGAYVKTSDEKLMNLPYKNFADICGAGPWSNFVFGLILIYISLYIDMIDTKDPVNWLQMLARHILLLIPAIFLFWKKWFSRYFIHLFGMLITFMIVRTFTNFGITQSVGGPIFIVQEAAKESANYVKAIFFAGLISINIGMLSSLPLVPLDGGKIIKHLLKRYTFLSRQFERIGTCLMIYFVLIILFSDFLRLFK